MADVMPMTGDPAGYESVRHSLVQHLDEDVLPFWVSSRVNDETYEGDLPHLDWQLHPTGGRECHVIVMLRLLYVHAVAISRISDPNLKAKLLDQYHRRFTWLRRRYWDEKNGGFFNEPCSRPTATKDTRSQVHALYFLAEVFLLLGHAEAMNILRALFALVDASGHDPVYGGYTEHFEWPCDDSRNRTKTLGVQMHMLLALTRMAQTGPAQVFVDRIEELTEILLSRFEIPGGGGNAYNAMTRAWKELQPGRHLHRRTVYGHSAELIWYVIESARVLGKNLEAVAPWAGRLAEGMLRFGIRPTGAVYFSGTYRGNAIDKRAWWWAQAEAMIAMLRVYEITDASRYWHAFESVRAWTFRHIVHGRSGVWIPFTNRWGFRVLRSRLVGYWQSGYHVTRALIECDRALARLRERRESPHPSRIG